MNIEQLCHTQNLSSINILVVDDQSLNRMVIIQQLKELEGIEFYQAASGLEALELSSRHTFALILLDIQMPNMDGYEVANILRSTGDTTPIIFVTAFGDDLDKQLFAYQSGGLDYICKPIVPEILHCKVNILIELYRSSKEIENYKDFYKTTLDNCFEGIFRTTETGLILYANNSSCTILGEELVTIVNQPIEKFLPGSTTAINDCIVYGAIKHIELHREAPSGNHQILQLNLQTIGSNSHNRELLIMIQDVSHQKQYETQLLSVSQKDGMTGLHNRAFFMVYFAKSLFRAQRKELSAAILAIDLNDFKLINDTLGHDAGDEVIKTTASRLQNNLRKSDLVARVGGDEFVILVEDTHEQIYYQTSQLAEHIAESLNESILFNERPISISTSIGIAISPDHGNDIKSLLKAADLAMYKAKKNRVGYEYYNANLRESFEIKSHITQTLKNNKVDDVINVVYQPIHFLNDERWAIEVLARWNAPGYTPSPLQFIPCAEQTGKILSLTQSVIKTVSKDLERITQYCNKLSYISINLSPKLIRQPSDLLVVLNAIEENGLLKEGLPPICLEITESTPIEFNDSLQHIWKEIEQSGLELAIDDFGAGHSSINYFESIPCKTVKLDRCLTNGITVGSKRFRIVQGITELAHDLGLDVVAEGIEDQESLEIVKAAGCDAVQGFHFSKPLSISQLENYQQGPSSVN